MSRSIKGIFLVIFLLLIKNTILHAQNCTVNADINKIQCSNEPMQLSGNSNGLFTKPAEWLQVGGPTVIIDYPSNLNSTISGYSGGQIYIFRIAATCQDGAVVHDDVQITVNSIGNANAGLDQESCPGTLILNANAPETGETGTWSIISNGGGLSGGSINSPSSSVNLPTDNAGTSVLRWTLANSSNGCSDYDEVNITNYGGDPNISAGPDQNLNNCYTTTQTTSLSGSYAGNGTGGQQGTWTMVSGPNYPTISNIHSANTTVSNLIEGTYIFRWKVSGPCVIGSDELTITVPGATQDVTIANAPDQRFCYQATTALLEGSIPQYANEQGIWTQVAGPPANITSPSSAICSVTGLDGTSTYRFQYKITNTAIGCTNINDNIYIRYSTAPTINAGGNQILACNETTATINLTTNGGTNTRYKIQSGPSGDVNWHYTNNPLILNSLQEGSYSVLVERYATGTGCTSAFDDINITVSESPTASNAGTDQILACNVAETYLAGNAPTTGIGIWSQVDGPNSAVITDIYNRSSHISNLIPGEYIFRWLIAAGNNCPVTQDEVKVIVSATAPSVAAGNDNTVCHSSEVILEGNDPAANATGKWTVSPNIGISFSDSTNPKASVYGMYPNTPYTFIWTITNACGFNTDNVVLTTNNVSGPSIASAGPDQCESSGTISLNMNGNNPAVGIGKWTILDGPNNSTITNESLFNTTITNMIDGHYKIEWSISVPNSVCQITKDTLFASIVTSTTSSSAGADKSVCGSTVSMTANAPATNETGYWSQISGNAGYNIDAITNYNATFSNLISGRYEFAWNIEKGICPSSSDALVITVSEPPTTSVTTSDYTVCSGTSATLKANNPDSGTGLWSISGVVTTRPTIASITDPSTTVTGLATGQYQFKWTITSGQDCPASENILTINISAPANAGSDQQLCNATETFLEGTKGTNGLWTHISGTPIPTISNNNVHTAPVFDMGLDNSYNFQYAVPAVYGCPATNDMMNVSTSSFGTKPDAGPDQEICTSGGNTIIMAGNNPGLGTGSWSQLSGPNTSSIASTDTYNTSVSNLVAGIYVFAWNVDYGYCGNYQDVMRVNVYDPPSIANAGPDQINACQLNAQLQGNMPTLGIGLWTLISAPTTHAASTLVIDNPNIPTSLISSITTIGDYTFRWTITNGSVCAVNTADVKISFTADSPDTSRAGDDKDLCTINSITMAGNNPVVGVGTWSQVSGPGGISITNPTVYNTVINNLQAGTYGFKWEIISGGCTLSDNMIVINSPLPSAADAGTNQNICQFESPLLIANQPTFGTGIWSVVSGTTNPTILNPNNSMTNVTGTFVGSYTFRWTISSGACTPTTANVNYTVVTNPITTLVVNGNEICDGSDGLVSINTTENSIFYEAFISSTPVGSVTGDGNNQNIIVGNTNLSLNTNYVSITATNATGCKVDLNNQVIIQVDPNPNAANAGSDQEVCMTGTKLNANNPIVGTGNWTTTGGSTFSNSTSYNSDVSNLDIGINTLNWTIANSATCPVSRDSMVITNYQYPTVANAGTNQNVCETDFTMNGNNPLIGTGLWTVISGGASFNNANLPNTIVSGLNYGTNTLRWTISNGICNNSSDDVIITSYQNPTVADAGADQEVCMTGATLNGNIQSIGNGIWSGSGGTIIDNPSFYNTSVSNLDIGINTFIWSISNGSECAVSQDNIVITNYQYPTVANAGTDQIICGSSTNLSANNPSIGTGVWSTSGGGIFATIGLYNTNVSNLNLATNILIWTISNGICPPSSNQMLIISNKIPDDSLMVSGNSICEYLEGSILISATENNIRYDVKSGSNIIQTGMGIGDDLNLQISTANLTVGSNNFDIIATDTSTNCSSQLLNPATITLNANPDSTLVMEGNTVCNDKDGTITIYSAESNIQYDFFKSDTVLITSITGNGDTKTIIHANDLAVGTNTFEVKATNQITSCKSKLINQVEIVMEQCDIIVYDGFSPNGDGLNDFFRIEGLEKHPNHKVTIFNRWGNKVYEASPYINNWDGTDMFGVTVGGKKLPVGTYFYIIDPGNGEKIIKGYVYLNY